MDLRQATIAVVPAEVHKVGASVENHRKQITGTVQWEVRLSAELLALHPSQVRLVKVEPFTRPST